MNFQRTVPFLFLLWMMMSFDENLKLVFGRFFILHAS